MSKLITQKIKLLDRADAVSNHICIVNAVVKV